MSETLKEDVLKNSGQHIFKYFIEVCLTVFEIACLIIIRDSSLTLTDDLFSQFFGAALTRIKQKI